MAQIELKREPTIKHKDIYISMFSDTPENMDNDYSPTSAIQTKFYGILCPIIAINGLVIDMADITSFMLDGIPSVPTIELEFYDRNDSFKRFLDVGTDNILQLQIIPPADDMYKKVNLDFYLYEFSADGGMYSCKGEYKLQALTDTRWKAMGEVSTYELMDKISLETGLGFASNVDVIEDKRYITASYTTYLDLMKEEISRALADGTQVYDWWIDFWDNLVICNLYDRIKSVDQDEDMQVWEQSNVGNITQGDESTYERSLALYTNAPGRETSNLYIDSAEPYSNPVSQNKGNSVATTCWLEEKHEYISDCILDGDVEADANVFTKYEYLGEVYGSYNYLMAEKARELYMDKMLAETLVVHTTVPQLCLNKGSQVKVVWYENNSITQIRQDQIDGLYSTYEEQISEIGWLKDFMPEKDENQPMLINLQISGQYTVLGQQIHFSGDSGTWDVYIKLTRPRETKPRILPNIEVEE